MCGIFGFKLNHPLSDSDLDLGRRGMESFHHRGPDNAGYWSDEDDGVFIGHTRLSIIDLSEQSHQPFVRDDSVLAYNGEIYNYVEIAEQLKNRGVNLTTTGDTEVLLRSWHTWGRSCVDRLDGMYAFALYDDRQVHLVTDPFGEKPMYWAETDDGVYFASEAGVLVRLLGLTPNFSSHDIAAFLSLGFLPSPKTGYRNLHRMGPANWLTISADGRVTTSNYWTPPEPVASKGTVQPLTEGQLDDITGALIDSLKVRLRSDVPLGLFLSSGVDSVLVAALAAKELDAQTLAFTVKFSDEEVADESGHAAKVAAHLGLPHKIVDSAEDPARTDPNVIFDLFGEVNDNLTVAAVYQMSAAAKPSLTVALSGLGGDEVFYGYNKYHELYRWRNWLALNSGVRKLLSLVFSQKITGRWEFLGRLLSSSDPCRFIGIKNLGYCRWLWELPDIEEWASEQFDNDIPVELMARHFDLTQTMPATYIPAIERGSMRASLEIRTPFLNRRLIELTSEMDQRAFIAFGQKSVPRRILGRYLDDELFNLPKRGFNYPLSSFIDNFSDVPRITGLRQSAVEEAWANRNSNRWRTLAVRLATLDHFMNAGTGSTAGDSNSRVRDEITV